MCPLALIWYNLFSIGCLYIENYFFFMHSTFLLFSVFTCTSGRFLFYDARRLTLHISFFLAFLIHKTTNGTFYHKLLGLLCRYALVYFVTKHTINIIRHLFLIYQGHMIIKVVFLYKSSVVEPGFWMISNLKLFI